MATTQIQVTASDNEIILIASAVVPAGGSNFISSDLLHYKSGYNKPVNVIVYPGAVLPSGNYTLTMIGINWGGPYNFSVAVTTNGETQVYNGSNANNNAPLGIVWSQNVPITVAAGQ